MSEITKSKKIGCLAIVIAIIFISIIVSIFKSDGYDVIKDESGVITANTEIEYWSHSIAASDIAEVVWKICKAYNAANKITLNITLEKKDFRGNKQIDKLDPYILDRENIIEYSKYQLDAFKYGVGGELASLHLMQNGYWPRGL